MENIGLNSMLQELSHLNPSAKFAKDWREYSVVKVIHGNVHVENLQLPDGYYYNNKNGITNKHNTTSGLYESFEYIYDPDYIFDSAPAPAPVVKKSFFQKIFGR